MDKVLLEDIRKNSGLNEGIHDKGNFKAIIVIGGPGSGKSYIVKNAISSPLWKNVNPDSIFIRALKKEGLSTNFSKLTDEEKKKRKELLYKSFDKNEKKRNQVIKNRLPLIIDMSGKSTSLMLDLKSKLENVGYEVKMIYIKAKIDTALKRNKERERSLDPKALKAISKDVDSAIPIYKKAFGGNFSVVENEPDSKNDLTKMWVGLNKWANKPVTNSKAKEWLKKQNG